jgi:hypothetical protein
MSVPFDDQHAWIRVLDFTRAGHVVLSVCLKNRPIIRTPVDRPLWTMDGRASGRTNRTIVQIIEMRLW